MFPCEAEGQFEQRITASVEVFLRGAQHFTRLSPQFAVHTNLFRSRASCSDTERSRRTERWSSSYLSRCSNWNKETCLSACRLVKMLQRNASPLFVPASVHPLALPKGARHNAGPPRVSRLARLSRGARRAHPYRRQHRTTISILRWPGDDSRN